MRAPVNQTELRKRLHYDSESGRTDTDCPTGRSAAGVQKIVSNDGRGYESEPFGQDNEHCSSDKGEEIAGYASVEYISAESSRNCDWENLQETEGRSEEDCTSSRQPGAASTVVFDGAAASLLTSSEAVLHAAYMPDNSSDGESVKCPICSLLQHMSLRYQTLGTTHSVLTASKNGQSLTALFFRCL
jgi:hypothetical protein